MKTLTFFAICLILSFWAVATLAQGVAISSTTTTADESAILDVQSTSQGILPPRMTQAQRSVIEEPAAGLLVYQTDSPAGYYYFTGSNWVGLEGSGTGSISSSQCIDYDGNAYPTFSIGNQVWMAENLRVTHYRNGDAIPNETDNTGWSGLTTGAYCWYDNNAGTNAKYGLLYNWHALNDSRGLCPAGWHAATDAEWNTFMTYLGGDDIAGGKMKSVSALWTSPNLDATNNSGFSGLPGGFRWGSDGTFADLANSGVFWIATEETGSTAWYRFISYSTKDFQRYSFEKDYGLSVRCIRD